MSKTCECGAEIEFATTPNGKQVPLRKIAHTYRIDGEKAVPLPNVYQSHYVDCPFARKFSGKNRDAHGPQL